ncbi:hypothetical protein [Streptacidiphilus sp. MAP12-20]|uniref:hypothetical protein n=1 Tax=Streptacidiphilus sp. MAP12-20 TaxID=3156299 RepID=UPI0035145E0C
MAQQARFPDRLGRRAWRLRYLDRCDLSNGPMIVLQMPVQISAARPRLQRMSFWSFTIQARSLLASFAAFPSEQQEEDDCGRAEKDGYETPVRRIGTPAGCNLRCCDAGANDRDDADGDFEKVLGHDAENSLGAGGCGPCV